MNEYIDYSKMTNVTMGIQFSLLTQDLNDEEVEAAVLELVDFLELGATPVEMKGHFRDPDETIWTHDMQSLVQLNQHGIYELAIDMSDL